MYDTIHGSPIILSRPFPKTPGSLSGAVILVDRGDQYVVARRFNDETTGKPQEEWGQGEYFPHAKRAPHLGPQEAALGHALHVFNKLVERYC